MSSSGKQSPLGVNTLAGLLQNKGFYINENKAGYMGASTAVGNYTYGSLVSNTVLNKLTDAIREGWIRYDAGDISLTTYENLYSIGTVTIPALGNTRPTAFDNTGDPGWGGLDYAGEIASYGYVRLFAWQAYNEFNYNDTLNLTGFYTDFLGSFLTARAFVEYSNKSIMTMQNSLTFLDGTYSNMNDLISADVSGVSLATQAFGQDLINTGRAINLAKISTFGLPSNLIQTCKKNNVLTNSLVLALLASGLTQLETESLILNKNLSSRRAQQKAYAAMLIVKGVDLAEILVGLNCTTQGLETLADLLNPKKLFPNSYPSLTVPAYNADPGPTNSKTYYPIYTGDSITPILLAPAIVRTIGTQPTPGYENLIDGTGGEAGGSEGGGFGGDSGGSDGGGGDGGGGGGGDGGGGGE